MSNQRKRLMELLAIGMIGEGVVGALRPRRHLQLWRFGPQPYQKMIKALTDHPTATRLMCVAEASLGVWLGLRQTTR